MNRYENLVGAVIRRAIIDYRDPKGDNCTTPETIQESAEKFLFTRQIFDFLYTYDILGSVDVGFIRKMAKVIPLSYLKKMGDMS